MDSLIEIAWPLFLTCVDQGKPAGIGFSCQSLLRAFLGLTREQVKAIPITELILEWFYWILDKNQMPRESI